MPAYRYQHGDRPLDGYTIQHALGRGGFGEVYFAVSDAGREVALKAVQNYEDIELRGISHCMNLKSSHLVMIFDVKQDEQGMAWVIMEYVSGANLREILDESVDGLGADQAAYFMRELCKGISYLHEAGVVHRDLKPHNIFFEDGVVKIGDYSLSKAISASHRSGHTSTVGSVHYMAPEIGAGHYDKTVDIYALGVILFEMLTGHPPYEGESMAEVLMKHLTGEPDVSGLPEPFRSIVTKAMRHDPGERYQNASEMLKDLSFGDSLEHSRPPASLSLIGERAVQDRAKRVLRPSALTETFVTPAALHDTHDDSDSLPFQRPTSFDLNTLGLWWQRPNAKAIGEDPIPVLVRLLIAFAACLLIVSLGCVGDVNLWSGEDTVKLAVGHAVFSSLVCWFYLSTMPRASGLRWSIVTRVLAVLPTVLLLIVFANMPFGWEHLEYFPVITGMLVSHAIMDDRCLLAADRYPRVGLAKTLIAGAITMILVFLVDGNSDHVLFGGAMVFSLSIVIQLLAPHGRLRGEPVMGEPGQTPVSRTQASSKPTSASGEEKPAEAVAI